MSRDSRHAERERRRAERDAKLIPRLRVLVGIARERGDEVSENMVERVARAIDPETWAHIDRFQTKSGDPDDLPIARSRSLDQARAAIAVLRDPTQEMIVAGMHAHTNSAKWHAMI